MPVSLRSMGPLFRKEDDLIPQMSAVIELPEMLEPSNKYLRIKQNKVIKDAFKHAMGIHHRKRIPQHFNRWRQKKYGYTERHPRTVASKRKRGGDQADLVKTGKTKHRMTTIMKIRAGGTASAGSIKVTGTMSFKAGFKRNPVAAKGVTKEVMRDEITRWTPREVGMAIMDIRREYIRLIDLELKSKKVRIRLGAKLKKMGITP